MPVIDIESKLTTEELRALRRKIVRQTRHSIAARNGRKGGLKVRNQKEAIAVRWAKYRAEKKIRK